MKSSSLGVGCTHSGDEGPLVNTNSSKTTWQKERKEKKKKNLQITQTLELYFNHHAQRNGSRRHPSCLSTLSWLLV
jgi:hypothetical protein